MGQRLHGAGLTSGKKGCTGHQHIQHVGGALGSPNQESGSAGGTELETAPVKGGVLLQEAEERWSPLAPKARVVLTAGWLGREGPSLLPLGQVEKGRGRLWLVCKQVPDRKLSQHLPGET